MTAVQRSNVLIRQEKGFGSITLPRLLMAGGVGAIVALFATNSVGLVPGCSSSAIVVAVILVLTHPIEGLPLFKFALRTMYGLATVAAIDNADGLPGLAAQLMQTNAEEGILKAQDEYSVGEDSINDDELDQGWAYLGDFTNASGHGLAIIDDPFSS